MVDHITKLPVIMSHSNFYSLLPLVWQCSSCFSYPYMKLYIVILILLHASLCQRFSPMFSSIACSKHLTEKFSLFLGLHALSSSVPYQSVWGCFHQIPYILYIFTICRASPNTSCACLFMYPNFWDFLSPWYIQEFKYLANNQTRSVFLLEHKFCGHFVSI